jgi:hypothetical protein
MGECVIFQEEKVPDTFFSAAGREQQAHDDRHGCAKVAHRFDDGGEQFGGDQGGHGRARL